MLISVVHKSLTVMNSIDTRFFRNVSEAVQKTSQHVFHRVSNQSDAPPVFKPDKTPNVFSIGVDYGTSVLTLCFLSHLRVHYCDVIPVK